MSDQGTHTIKVSDGWCSAEIRIQCELCGAEIYGGELCAECEVYVGIWEGGEIVASRSGQSRPTTKEPGK